MKQQDRGASLRDRATHEQSPQAVSAVPVSVPSAFITRLRNKANEFKWNAEKNRREARDLELRASEQYDAYISFDMLADNLAELLDEARASAMSAGTAETPQEAQGEARQPDPQGDAQPKDTPDHA